MTTPVPCPVSGGGHFVPGAVETETGIELVEPDRVYVERDDTGRIVWIACRSCMGDLG